MKEVTPIPRDAIRFLPPKDAGATQVVRLQEQQVLPAVFRPKGVRIFWSQPGYTLEQNEQIGIQNIQALFLERFPEFLQHFSFEKDGKIAEGRREEAKNFITARIGTLKQFISFFNKACVDKTRIPYFQGSHVVALEKSFSPWGLTFPELKRQAGRRPTKQDKEQFLLLSGIKSLQKEDACILIEEAARIITQRGIPLTRKSLSKAGFYYFYSCVKRFYPGKLRVLQERLGLPITGRDRKRKPSAYWTPERTIEELKVFVETHGDIAKGILESAGRYDLEYAVEKYPGGIAAVRERLLQLGILLTRKRRRKDRGAWTSERTEEEAMNFYREEGALSYRLLLAKGRRDLWHAVERYTGCMTALKEKLGIIKKDPEQQILLDLLTQYGIYLQQGGEPITIDEFIRRVLQRD